MVIGKVTDAKSGEALIGVNVMVVGSTTGTITDIDGNYEITAAPDATLRFSYTGFEDQDVGVNRRNSINLSLSQGLLLDEVVVTALGIKRDKKALNYSVTEVGGEGFQEAREINIANALSGKIAGVNVSNVASGPAGSSRVIIRGNTSLGGNNQPLYVIDGVPIDNSGFGQAGLWGGADEGDGTSSINPDDIETISVLKGANAAALYGSRASNGVILITTKSGKSGEGIGVEFTSNYVGEKFINHFDLQDQFGHGREGRAPSSAAEAWNVGSNNNWGTALDGSSVPQFDGQSRPYVSQLDDNLNKFFETGQTFTNTIGFTGGDENNKVRINFSDLRSKSIIPQAGFDRQNVSFSYNGNFGDKLTLTTKILYSHENSDNRPNIADSPGNAYQAIVRLPLNYNIDDLRGDPDKPGAITADFIPPDGKSVGEELQISNDLWNQNPWWASNVFSNDDTRDRIINSTVAKFDVTDFLYVQGRFSMDWYTRRETNLTPYGTGFARTGRLSEVERRVREVNVEGIVGANKSFGNITLDAVAGGNRMRRSSESISLGGNDFNIPFFNTFSNLNNQSPGYGFSQEGINSVFGSATFGYNNFLYLTATARNDWFSTLSRETNSIFYPSLGGSLILSEIMDLSSTSPITFAKLRASWAQVGGDTDPYRLDLTYGLGQGHNGQANAVIQQSSIPNRLLKPLTSSEFEIGFDLRMFQNRVGVDFTWYKQKTTDDILNATISETSGFSTTTINIGEISNSGVELLLSGTPIQSSGFSWDISLNLAYNDSEVVSLSEGIDRISVGGNLGVPRTRWAFVNHIVGRPFGTITGFVQEEINGQPVFDANTGQPIQSNNAEIIGNGVHKYSGGINNSFSIGKIHADFLVDFKAGGQIYSGSNVRLLAWGLHKMTTEEWTAPGIVANGRESVQVTGVDQEGNPLSLAVAPENIQGFYGAYSQLSDRFIRNSSFAKLRQMSVGYSFPNDILNKMPLTNLKVSLVARNLLVLYSSLENVDPESTYNNSNAQGLDYFGLPQTRTLGVNLKANF